MEKERLDDKKYIRIWYSSNSAFEVELRRCRPTLHFLISSHNSPRPCCPREATQLPLCRREWKLTFFFSSFDFEKKKRPLGSPIPFDFLVNASLLRSSLGAYCAATNTSEEITLEIEYLPSTLPPQLESTIPSEDWVSDVSVGVRGCVVLHHLFFCPMQFTYIQPVLFLLPRSLAILQICSYFFLRWHTITPFTCVPSAINHHVRGS